METATKYKYDAFISYTRHDTKDWKASRWIYRQLGRFIIPRDHRRVDSNGKPIRRLRVFRDASDHPGGPLQEILGQKLHDSENLILVSSLEAGKAAWVEKEVSMFLGSHAKDDGFIMPLLADGNLVGDSFPESFNSIQKDREYTVLSLVPIVNEGTTSEFKKLAEKDHNYGKKHCLYSIISTLTGIERRDLEKRILRQRISRILSYVGPVFLISILLLLYRMPRYEYYAEYNRSYGIPVGIMPLTQEQLSHRCQSYRFEYRRIPLGEPNALTWRLSKVEAILSSGVTSNISALSPILELKYAKSNGTLVGTVSRNSAHAITSRSTFSNNGENLAVFEDIQSTSEGQGSSFLNVDPQDKIGPHFQEMEVKTSISRFAYERDTRGFVVKKSYHANNDYRLDKSAVCDENGIWAVEQKVDSLGNITEKRFLAKDGSPTCTKEGVAREHRSYDDNGLLTEISYYDLEGNPTVSENVHKLCITRDIWGNSVEECYFGVDGQPCINDEWYFKVITTCDEKGRMVSDAYFDTEGNPCYRAGYSPIIRFDYDSKGRIASEAFFSQNGEPVTGPAGNHLTRMEYNKKGQTIKVLMLDVNYHFMEDAYNYMQEYDRNGHIIRQIFIQEDGTPIRNGFIFGGAASENEYDAQGNLVAQTLLDENLKPVVGVIGWARWKAEFDERGNVRQVAYFDADGHPIWNDEVKAPVLKTEYDDFGHRTQISYHDEDGTPINNTDSYSKVVFRYDESGNLIEKAWFDVDGNLTLAPDDYYSIVRYKYDSHRNVIEMAYYDLEDNRCVAKSNMDDFSFMRFDYDKKGYIIRQTVFSVDEKPLRIQQVLYDKYGRSSGFKFLDDGNRPVRDETGVSSVIMERDARGLLLRQVSFSDFQQKTPFQDILFTYDEKGDLQTVEFKYEDKGRNDLVTIDQIDEIVFGPFGEFFRLYTK